MGVTRNSLPTPADTTLYDYSKTINGLEYGVTGNGTTDDTAAIQAAIDACSAGWRVVLNPGTFKVSSSIKMKPAVALEGPTFTSRWPYRTSTQCTIRPTAAFTNEAVIGFYGKNDLSALGLGISISGENYGAACRNISINFNDVPYVTSRSVSDGVTTSADATVTSATAAFVAGDVGRRITGTGIPDNTTIASINSGTSIEMSNNATASGTGITLAIGPYVIDAFRFEGDVRNCILENCDAWHATGSTVHTVAGVAGTDGGTKGRGHQILRVSGDGDSHAFYFEDGLTDSVLWDCLAWSSSDRTESFGDGFWFDDCAETHIIGCRAVFRNGNGFYLGPQGGADATGGPQFTNISTDRNQKRGLFITRTGFGNNLFNGVRLHRDGINGRNVAGQEATRDSTYAALEIQGVSASTVVSPVVIAGLSISNSDNDESVGAKAPDVGIRLQYCSSVDIEGIISAVVTPVDDLGSHKTVPVLPVNRTVGERTGSRTYGQTFPPVGVQYAEVATSQTILSTTYSNLTTTGPDLVFRNVPANSIIMLYLEATMTTSNAADAAQVSVSEVTGTTFTTQPLLSTNATSATRIRTQGGSTVGTTAAMGGWVAVPSGTAGTKTVRMLYKSNNAATTATFSGRKIWGYIAVEPTPA